MTGYIKFTRAASVGGKQFSAGSIAEFDADTVRELLRKGVAVPSGGPGRRSLTTDPVQADVHPVVRRS